MRQPRIVATALACLIAWTLHTNFSARNPDPDLVTAFSAVVPHLPAGSIAFKGVRSDKVGRAGLYAYHALVLAAAPRPVALVDVGPPDTDWAIGYRVGAIRGYEITGRFGHGIRLYRRLP